VVEDRNERARGRRRDDEEGESRGRRKSPEAPRHAEKIEDWPVDGLTLPGFVNAHSHAFQRAMRGRAEGADFWAWREAMLDLARAQGAGRVRKEYVDVYREMLAAGYTAVGDVHADEQPREIEECLAEHGVRPIELLDRCGCLSERTTVVHATHADGAELDLLAAAGTRVCACPTTEANLGDGFLPVERLLHRGIGLCIGSDSNVRIDPLEELRELDGIARRQSGRRDVFSVDQLLEIGSERGATALGLESWPETAVDVEHPQLAGVEDWRSALVAACSADVLRTPS